MSKKIEIMRPVDDFVFKKLDEGMNHTEVQKILDQYSTLDEKVQDIVKNGIAAALIIVPAILVMILWSMNSSLQDKLAMKKETLSLAQSVVSKEAQLSGLKRKYINPTAMSTQGAFQGKISSALSSSGIDSSKVDIGSFETIPQDALILESRLEVKFSKFSNIELFNFINSLSLRSKIKIDEINVRKNTSDNLLQGVMKLIYYGKESEPVDDF